jgi:hypothetical protein
MSNNLYVLARRQWKNASAAVTMEENGNVFVTGKYYDGYTEYQGPVTSTVGQVPSHLRAEAKRMRCNQFESLEMEEFCDDMFEEARMFDHWFEC